MKNDVEKKTNFGEMVATVYLYGETMIPPQYRPRFYDVVELLSRKCGKMNLDDIDDLLLQVHDLIESF